MTTTSEPLIIQQFQQCREALRIAVVGCRRQKQFVFKVRNQRRRAWVRSESVA